MDMTLIPLQAESIDSILGHEIPIAQIALGLLLGLLGWPMYAGLIRLAGALVGLTGGLALVIVAEELHPMGDWLVPALIVAAIIGALLGVFLVRRVMMMVWLLLGASLGVLALWALRMRGSAPLPPDGWSMGAQAAVWAGAALISGLLTVWFRRGLVIVATAILGAALIGPNLEPLGPPTIAWICALTVAFTLVQAGIDRMIGFDREPPEVKD
jgi:hypothetical protein